MRRVRVISGRGPELEEVEEGEDSDEEGGTPEGGIGERLQEVDGECARGGEDGAEEAGA